MFSGLLTKILLGALGLSLTWGGINYVKWNYWNKPGYEAEIKKLKDEKLELQIKTQAQEATIKYLGKAREIQVRVTDEKKEIGQVVDHGSLDDLDKLYGRYRMRPGDSGTPQGRQGRNP